MINSKSENNFQYLFIFYLPYKKTTLVQTKIFRSLKQNKQPEKSKHTGVFFPTLDNNAESTVIPLSHNENHKTVTTLTALCSDCTALLKHATSDYSSINAPKCPILI